MKKYRYKKNYRTKKKKIIFSIFLSRFFWLGLLIFVILGVIFYFVIFSSFFQTKQVNISGNEKISAEDIKIIIRKGLEKKFLFFSTKSIFLINLNKIKEEILSSFPRIAGIEIKRKLPNILDINVVEKLAIAVFCFARPNFDEQNLGGQEEKCFLLDSEGVIFEETQPRNDLIRLTDKQKVETILGKNVIKKDYLDKVLKIQKEVLKELKLEIKEFTIFKERLNAKTADGWEIYFNPQKDLDWQLTELVLVLKEKIPLEKRGNLEYIDLRFEKIYIFPAIS